MFLKLLNLSASSSNFLVIGDQSIPSLNSLTAPIHPSIASIIGTIVNESAKSCTCFFVSPNLIPIHSIADDKLDLASLMKLLIDSPAKSTSSVIALNTPLRFSKPERLTPAVKPAMLANDALKSKPLKKSSKTLSDGSSNANISLIAEPIPLMSVLIFLSISSVSKILFMFLNAVFIPPNKSSFQKLTENNFKIASLAPVNDDVIISLAPFDHSLIGSNDSVDIDFPIATIGDTNALNALTNGSIAILSILSLNTRNSYFNLPKGIALANSCILFLRSTNGLTHVTNGDCLLKLTTKVPSRLNQSYTETTTSMTLSIADDNNPNTENRALNAPPITIGISLMSAIFLVTNSTILNGTVSILGMSFNPSDNLPSEFVNPSPIASVICLMNRYTFPKIPNSALNPPVVLKISKKPFRRLLVASITGSIAFQTPDHRFVASSKLPKIISHVCAHPEPTDSSAVSIN